MPPASHPTRSASRTHWPPRPTRSRRAFPPQDLDLAVAAFLLKILDPAFFVRDRPNRASPRATKKAGDFPARKDQPSVVRVTRRLQIHCLRPQQAKRKAIERIGCESEFP